MRDALRTVAAVRPALSTRRELVLEGLALRHQLGVLARSNRRFRASDRLSFAKTPSAETPGQKIDELQSRTPWALCRSEIRPYETSSPARGDWPVDLRQIRPSTRRLTRVDLNRKPLRVARTRVGGVSRNAILLFGTVTVRRRNPPHCNMFGIFSRDPRLCRGIVTPQPQQQQYVRNIQ